jgi:probable phosphoglycerate mutase
MVPKIGVVAHGGVLECAYRIAHQLPLHAPRTANMLNASINRFELTVAHNQPQLKLVQWGDVAHLDASLDEIIR